MSLEKKVGRLMIAGFKGLTMSAEIKSLIHDYHIGGIILFGRNIGTPEEIARLTSSLQAEAKKAGYTVPLLICIDQENGVVRRLGEGTTIIPGAMLLGATHDSENARKAGTLTGKELKALGINWNLAPVVDVNNNPKNPVIGVRSFGENPNHVAEMAEQAMVGMQNAGVVTTLKHFPGHGDTNVDSHLDLPVIPHDLKRLHDVELVPFKRCIQAGADTVMSAHIYFPALEPEANTPATLSRPIITGLLREELGFQGVITTDCMEMDAIAKGVGTVQGCVQAVQAGVDFVMVSHQFPLQKQAILALKKAVENGEIPERQVDESVERIEKLVRGYATWEETEIQSIADFVGSDAHRMEMRNIYEQGITEVGKRGKSILPEDRALLIFPTNKYATMVEDQRYATVTMAEELRKVHADLTDIEIPSEQLEEQLEQIGLMAPDYDHIVVLTLNAFQHSNQQRLVETLISTGKPVDIVAIRSPYDLSLFSHANRMICTYEFTRTAFEVVADGLVGNIEFKGRLPVSLP
ncbi:beta-N-acetylhexosaminidase [Sporosarcina luteola]|nr:beta-N-acetylhexosaminidase [Sporosarcina luteola]